MTAMLTQSETIKAVRELGYALVVAAIFGGLTSFAALLHLAGPEIVSRGLSSYHVWIVICGALGAPIALVLARDEFGRAGLGGFARAVAGTLWVSLFAAVIAGTLALPLYGTMFGPFSMAIAFTSSPLLGLVWLATMVGVHLRLRGLEPRLFDDAPWRTNAAYARLQRLD